MTRVPVTSSNIASVGYEAGEGEEPDGTLEIEFRSGHLYAYEAVPEALYRELLTADSPGKFARENIIGSFESKRL